MEFKQKLKYNNGKLDFYHFGNVHEGGITAKVIIVPGEFFDNHMKHSIKLKVPVMASGFYKNHKDYDYMVGNVFDGENLIFIRDKVFELATKEELQTLVEHEYGHIFFGHTDEIYSRFDHDEQLADIFVDDWKNVQTLEKKWTIYNYPTCKNCKSSLILEEKLVKNHWFLYCQHCGFWIGDGLLNPFFVEQYICKTTGKKLRFPEDNFNPLLSREQDMFLTDTIVKSQLLDVNR